MPGFDFSNYNRNAALHAKGVPLPRATSTGTTIVGCIFNGGVVVCLALCSHGALRDADPESLSWTPKTLTSYPRRSLQTLAPPPAPSLPTRTARSFTTLLRKYGAPAPARLLTPNSPPPSSPHSSSCTRSQPAASPESSPA